MLAAQAVANFGTAAIVGGDVGPLLIGRFNALVAVVAFAAGVALHLGAQRILHYVAEDLKPEPLTWDR